MGAFPKQVKIVEVGPRDGLQNEKVKMEISQPKRGVSHICVGISVGKLDRIRWGLLIKQNIMKLLREEYIK